MAPATLQSSRSRADAMRTGPWSLGAAEERKHLKFARLFVIKVGTPVATHAEGGIAIARIGGIVEQIVQLVKRGNHVVIVSSGAIGHGMLRMKAQAALSTSLRDMRAGQSAPAETIDLKAAAAVGQSGLMSMYDMLFREYNMTVAQILVTEEDWSDADALSQLRATTAELLSLGAIPIVNENDAISMRGVEVMGADDKVQWDNDDIAARLASGLHADGLLVLTDFAHLCTRAADGSAQPMHTFDPALPLCLPPDRAAGAAAGAVAGTSMPATRLAREGLDAMVESAVLAIKHGVRATIILSGMDPCNIARVIDGEEVGTIFLATH
ncbi:hypothetical protein KFE25_013924 [Diacronema lutheri]|uniref:Aspartate/glutamate/uridylate kinase domain-containing protein n=1 Tax=Diacronema lutheri TaxID=2081491 RepID=A0A8J5XMQ5_DIALT|nr:hypothetical protein KFE25_013924 [Diacronema lutheri]